MCRSHPLLPQVRTILLPRLPSTSKSTSGARQRRATNQTQKRARVGKSSRARRSRRKVTRPRHGALSPVPVVNSIRLAWDVESVDPLRDVVSLQNDFWGCRRSVSTAGSTGSRDLGVATADRRPATGQTWPGAIFGSRQNGPRLGLPSISEIPRCTCDRPTRHRGPVASRWFPMLLALEVEAPSGPTSGAA